MASVKSISLGVPINALVKVRLLSTYFCYSVLRETGVLV
ncbi:Putative protein [Zobellia galactanivorans]|uniref:Uncharacterized protein n=1 Tax=Zobellia galactanivorans (strain DSM 12802 / CCUG 47099 / CIP 106680 / NCIMB 13871 / Dsij) TaxID=63186 RepID=G0LCQ7_ZOBGA|nr:Putative protein [Zobellia galactanivorans]